MTQTRVARAFIFIFHEANVIILLFLIILPSMLGVDLMVFDIVIVVDRQVSDVPSSDSDSFLSPYLIKWQQVRFIWASLLALNSVEAAQGGKGILFPQFSPTPNICQNVSIFIMPVCTFID